ncbi:hypothetical protein BZG36_00826 [Bifiguratus adelaidae]|uniref:Ubiquitin-like protein ATG12 n=1 Tax=Bifiguratus adelaidae TaxID=1938954 RepID=A0A261Y6N1_9FUNG|nr:hypothetical protein BZG36_00826 [Bifiguratus adelaidae]
MDDAEKASSTPTTPTTPRQEPAKQDVPHALKPLVVPGDTPRDLQQVVALLKKKDTSKVVVRFRAIGNAPIMKQNYYTISASNKFQAVIKFLRKELNYKSSDQLFVYINSAFSPSPDEIVANLHKCFSTDGQLIINYCTSAAWG